MGYSCAYLLLLCGGFADLEVCASHQLRGFLYRFSGTSLRDYRYLCSASRFHAPRIHRIFDQSRTPVAYYVCDHRMRRHIRPRSRRHPAPWRAARAGASLGAEEPRRRPCSPRPRSTKSSPPMRAAQRSRSSWALPSPICSTRTSRWGARCSAAISIRSTSSAPAATRSIRRFRPAVRSWRACRWWAASTP